MENPATAADSMLPIPATNTSSAIAASKRRAELAVTELLGVAQKKVKSEGEGINPVMSIRSSSDEVSIEVKACDEVSIEVKASAASGADAGAGARARADLRERKRVRSAEIELPLLRLCFCNAVCWFVIAAAVLGVLIGVGSSTDSFAGSFVGVLCDVLPILFLSLSFANYVTGLMCVGGTLSDKLRVSHRLHCHRSHWILVFYLTPRVHLARRIMLHLARERQHPNYMQPTLL